MALLAVLLLSAHVAEASVPTGYVQLARVSLLGFRLGSLEQTGMQVMVTRHSPRTLRGCCTKAPLQTRTQWMKALELGGGRSCRKLRMKLLTGTLSPRSVWLVT